MNMYYGEGGTTAFKRSSNGLWANDDTEPGLHRKKLYNVGLWFNSVDVDKSMLPAALPSNTRTAE